MTVCSFLLVLIATTEPVVVNAVQQDRSELDLLEFLGPASSASAAMTALALNAGSKKAAEWFYLSDSSKSEAAHAIKYFEDKTRISLSVKKTTFFCSTILYLQSAAAAIHKDAALSSASTGSQFMSGSVSSTVSSLLSSYPAAVGYGGYCIQLFPSPLWQEADPPCEGGPNFPEEGIAPGISLFSLKCLAASDFDWRAMSSGSRPGGVSALTAKFASVSPYSSKPVCSSQHNWDMLKGIAGMIIQSLFTQLMVGPVSAMLTMEIREICNGGFEDDNCLRFENIADLFFESWNAAHNLADGLQADVQCLLFRADVDTFRADFES